MDWSNTAPISSTRPRSSGSPATTLKLLEAIVADPDKSIFSLPPILSDAELQSLLIDWNNTATEFPEKTRCLHQLN